MSTIRLATSSPAGAAAAALGAVSNEGGGHGAGAAAKVTAADEEGTVCWGEVGEVGLCGDEGCPMRKEGDGDERADVPPEAVVPRMLRWRDRRGAPASRRFGGAPVSSAAAVPVLPSLRVERAAADCVRLRTVAGPLLSVEKTDPARGLRRCGGG